MMCQRCGQECKTYKHGMCQDCYGHIAKCSDCGVGSFLIRGMCNLCLEKNIARFEKKYVAGIAAAERIIYNKLTPDGYYKKGNEAAAREILDALRGGE